MQRSVSLCRAARTHPFDKQRRRRKQRTKETNETQSNRFTCSARTMRTKPSSSMSRAHLTPKHQQNLISSSSSSSGLEEAHQSLLGFPLEQTNSATGGSGAKRTFRSTLHSSEQQQQQQSQAEERSRSHLISKQTHRQQSPRDRQQQQQARRRRRAMDHHRITRVNRQVSLPSSALFFAPPERTQSVSPLARRRVWPLARPEMIDTLRAPHNRRVRVCKFPSLRILHRRFWRRHSGGNCDGAE